MREELKDRFDSWENQPTHSKRKVKVITVTNSGEYIFQLLEGCDLDLEGRVVPIRAKRIFMTRGQSNNSQEKAINDIYVFDMLCEIVSRSFLDKESDAIEQWIGGYPEDPL